MLITPHRDTLRGYAPAGGEQAAGAVWPAFPADQAPSADPAPFAAGTATAGDSASAPIPVRVLADDAVTRQAMLACLRTRPNINVLADDADPARVVLVLAEQVTDGTLAQMRQAATASMAATAAAATTPTTTAAAATTVTTTAASPPHPPSAPHAVGFVLVGDGLRAHHLLAAIACGPVSVLTRREADTDRVVRAITGIPQGRLELPGDAVGWLAARLRTIHRDVLEPRGLTVAGLGTREVEVLRLLAEGLDTAAIAEAMNYSERTVKSIIHGVLTRWRLRNRAHAVAFAVRSGAL